MQNNTIVVIEDFITEELEQFLISLERQYPGNYRESLSAPGRMIRFGKFSLSEDLENDKEAIKRGYKTTQVRRSYSQMNDGIDVSVDRVPSEIEFIQEKLVELGILKEPTPIVVLNVYGPGQRVARHQDHPDNGPLIPIIALQSDSELIFTSPNKTKKKVVKFPRRSLLIMQGPLRETWFHELPSIPTPRMSLIFRNIPKQGEITNEDS